MNKLLFTFWSPISLLEHLVVPNNSPFFVWFFDFFFLVLHFFPHFFFLKSMLQIKMDIKEMYPGSLISLSSEGLVEMWERGTILDSEGGKLGSSYERLSGWWKETGVGGIITVALLLLLLDVVVLGCDTWSCGSHHITMRTATCWLAKLSGEEKEIWVLKEGSYNNVLI